jgi:hypothetical protein
MTVIIAFAHPATMITTELARMSMRQLCEDARVCEVVAAGW